MKRWWLSGLALAAVVCGCMQQQEKTVAVTEPAPAPKEVRFTVDPVFSSHMVLQREKPIRVFGTADAPVTVTFAGKTVSASPVNGKWCAEFPAMAANKKEQTLTVTGGTKTVKMDDILIGDVWFCSGQSNMAMPIGGSMKRGWSAENAEIEIKNADHPQLRIVKQVNVKSHLKTLPAAADKLNKEKSASWVRSAPEYAPNVSAAAYFFGRKIQQDMDVPVGIVISAWGGTRIEAWISDQTYQTAPGLDKDRAVIGKFRMTDAQKKDYEKEYQKEFVARMGAWGKVFAAELAKVKKSRDMGWTTTNFNPSEWRPAKAEIPGTYSVLRFRNEFELPDLKPGTEVKLKFRKFADGFELFVNGQTVASCPPTMLEKDIPGELTLPANLLKPGRNVLGATGIYLYGWRSRGLISRLLNNVQIHDGTNWDTIRKGWKMGTVFVTSPARLGGKAAPRYELPYTSPSFQSNLYNGMVDGWTKLPIKGVIWYQGCSNAGEAHYLELHRALIADWRARWNTPDLPFMIVQLAGYEPRHAKDWQTQDATNVSGYALTRDIQQQMLNIPNVGLACAIDIGEAANIHPMNKQDIGIRLALEAERIAYGKKIVSAGPLFAAAKAEGNAIRVSFKNAANGLKTSDGEAPGAFAIAGEDGKFVWADAKIDGNTVLVSSARVPAPKYVRYAYAGYRGDANLQNAEGLPAYPFRSNPQH